MASPHRQKTGRDLQTMEGRMYEAHFRHSFVQYHPWGDVPDRDPPCELQVLQLCHATHNEQARKIDLGDGSFHFKPRPKVGKWGDKSHYCTEEWSQVPGEKKPSYQLIPEGEDVFPGYYSWWGLAVDPSDDPPLDSLPKSFKLPPYLKRPRESIYGGNAFMSNFSDLLRLYASSRDCLSQHIYLKMGGTLRYKHEIGYVVIICTFDDLEKLKTYKPITDAPSGVFDPNGLVDGKGKIENVARVPLFTTRFMDTYSSYETLSFGFYFPSPEKEFQCGKQYFKRCAIKHNDKDGLCIRRVKKHGKLQCPDNTDI